MIAAPYFIAILISFASSDPSPMMDDDVIVSPIDRLFEPPGIGNIDDILLNLVKDSHINGTFYFHADASEYGKLSTPTTTTTLEQSITTVFGLLISYISENSFDLVGFALQAKRYASQISQLLDAAKTLQSEHELPSSITQQLLFVKLAFEQMIERMKDLYQCSHVHSPGSRLLYKLIELEVRILALYTSDGSLDYNRDNIGQKLDDLLNSVYFWKSRFDSLSHKSPRYIQKLFLGLFHRAEGTLINLNSDFEFQSPNFIISGAKLVSESSL